MARYSFSSPEICFGEEAIGSLSQLNHQRVAIVTDDVMLRAGNIRYLTDHMPQAAVSVFVEVRPDPDADLLAAGDRHRCRRRKARRQKSPPGLRRAGFQDFYG
jgi:1-propanol dehydrogenase